MSALPHAPWTLEGREPYGEADTRAKLIDPQLYAAQKWTEEHIRRRLPRPRDGSQSVFRLRESRAKSGGADQVPDLRGSASSHFIACTVELLSTGVDVPCLQNIAFMQLLGQPIVFAQMLGAGTRLDPDSGKLMFRVFDYTEATSL